MPTRKFDTDYLGSIGIPDPYTADAVRRVEPLFAEQIDSRRWVSVHHLVFRGPDDGKAWRVTFERGLTENQEDHDSWNYEREVTAVEVEQVATTVMEWHAIPDAPALSGIAAAVAALTAPTVEEQPEPFIPRTEREYWQAIADALNAANAVGMPVGIDLDGTLTDHNAHSVIWNFDEERWEVAGYDDVEEGEQPSTPAPYARVTLRPTDTADQVHVEAESGSMNPAVIAHGLRQAADEFDNRARAQGIEPIARAAEEQPATGDVFTEAAVYASALNAAAIEAENTARAFGDETESVPTVVTLLDLASRFRSLAHHHTTNEQPAGLTWEARTEHAVRLYATTAIERDDARAEAARLREQLATAVTDDELAERISTAVNQYLNDTDDDDPDTDDLADNIVIVIKQAGR